jgi:ABC-type nitrate/sulfonate/bicarbonate transport system substrate-binding protein
MTITSRRRFRLIGVLATAAITALIATGCAGTSTGPTEIPSVAADLTKLNVAFGFLSSVEYAGEFVADAEGYYAEGGIEPTFISGGPNAMAPEVALASGQAQIAIESNTSRLFSYLAKADDIVIIGQSFQRSPSGLLSLKNRPVRNAKELNGSRIIAGAPNASSIDALMAINNVTDYEFIPGGADIGALQSGQGDALLSFASNQPVVLERQGLKAGEDFYFTALDELDYYFMSGVIIVSRTFLEENRELVANFLKATAKGWEKAFEDPAAAAELTVSAYATDQGLDPAQQTAVLKAQIPFMTSDFSKANGLLAVDTNYIESKVYPSLEKAGLTGLPDLTRALDTSVLMESRE